MGCEWLAGLVSRVCLYTWTEQMGGAGLRMPEWLAGLVWEGLGGQGLGCKR